MKVTVEDGSERVTIEGGHAKAVADWDRETVTGVLVKAVPDRRYTLTVAYPADKADTAVAADGHRDFASKEAVEQAAWDYLANSPKVGLAHKDGTDGAGKVVESYVYRGPDWTVAAGGGEHVVKAGDWMLGIVWSEQTWPDVLAGKIGGVSMQGSARRRAATAEAIAALRG